MNTECTDSSVDSQDQNKNFPELSVIIPTRNRPDVLLQTLCAIEEQTLEHIHFEVIVVDDGSDEANRTHAKQIQPSFPYQLLEKEHGGLASARNFGADRAAGEILLFLDDDVIPAPECFEQHLSSHGDHSQSKAVVGSLPYPTDMKMTPFLWYMWKSGHYDLYSKPEKYPEGVPPLPPVNGNTSISKKVFLKTGKYDEVFREYGGEDLELGYRLSKQGVKFVYNPKAVGYHNHAKDFKRFCLDVEKSGAAVIKIYQKYPEIKRAKKIDVLTDSISSLDNSKKVMKIVMTLTMICPLLLILPRLIIFCLEPMYITRYILFPCYRWIAYYYYACGMRKALNSMESENNDY